MLKILKNRGLIQNVEKLATLLIDEKIPIAEMGDKFATEQLSEYFNDENFNPFLPFWQDPKVSHFSNKHTNLATVFNANFDEISTKNFSWKKQHQLLAATNQMVLEKLRKFFGDFSENKINFSEISIIENNSKIFGKKFRFLTKIG